MRRRTMAGTAAGVLALAAGTTAIAAPGGGPLGLLGDREERHGEEAQALGKKLGVAPRRVERALHEVRRERREARQDAFAAELAKRLDVPAADAERALERGFAATRPELRRGFERGKRSERGEQPNRGARAERRERRDELAGAIAGELDKSPGEVTRALGAIRAERIEQRLGEAVRAGRLTEGQADEILERAKSGEAPGLHRLGRPFGPPGGGHRRGGPGGPGLGGPPEGGGL